MQASFSSTSGRTRIIAVLALAIGAFASVLMSSTLDQAAASQPPVAGVTDVSPATGPAAGGNTVVVTVSNIDYAQGVWFGETPARVISESSTAYTVVVPAGLAGLRSTVTVYEPQSNYPRFTKEYRYEGEERLPVTVAPSSGPPEGGNTVVVTGAGIDFSRAASVKFGDQDAPIVSKAATSVSVEVPAGLPTDSVRVSVTRDDGHIDGTLARLYTYALSTKRPVITKISPNEAFVSTSISDYQTVFVQGTGLEGMTEVTFGGRKVDAYIWQHEVRLRVPANLDPGVYDVEVTTQAGVSANTAADDFTFVARPAPPVIESITPNSGSRWGGTRVTVRGRNFSQVTRVSLTDAVEPVKDVTISDTEIQFTTGISSVAEEVELELFAPAGGTATSRQTAGDGFTFVSPTVPAISSFTPTTGPVTGRTVVTIKGTNLNLVTGARFDDHPVPASDVAVVSETEVRVTTPAVSAPVDAGLYLLFDGGHAGATSGPFTYTAVSTPTSTPTPSPTEEVIPYSYAISGSATLKSLTTGSLPLSGSVAAKLSLPSGAFRGTLTLAPSTGKLVALGFLPVTAKVNLVATDEVTGTLTGGKLKATAKVRIKLPSVKALGIELAGGANCQAKQISSIPLASTQPTFMALSGGPLAGTFGISDLSGCGFLTGIVSPLTKGNGNAIALNLTPER
jgi:hypothetical protein